VKKVATRTTDGAPDEVPLDGLAANPDELQGRVDVVVPRKIRGLAADCYDGGLDPDLTIKVNFRLRVLRGKLFTQNVHIEKSELGDHPELERCIVAAVERAEWRDDDMPDFDEDQELFIRLRTLKKYKNRGGEEDEGGDD
jgi:lipoate-protein ligase A